MSRRLLQIYAGLNVLVAFYNGGRFLLLGIGAVPGAIADPTAGILDTWYRVLGWLWITVGLMLAWITPRIGKASSPSRRGAALTPRFRRGRLQFLEPSLERCRRE